LKHIDRVDDVIKFTIQKGNIDIESEEGMLGDDPMGKHKFDPDYQKCLDDITRIVDKAARMVDMKTEAPYDYYTGRKPNATTLYVAIEIQDSDLVVIAISNPVELKKVAGVSHYVFNIESEDGYIDNKYTGLTNATEISKALKTLLNESLEDDDIVDFLSADDMDESEITNDDE
jgi:hypothetical protein